MAEARIHPPSQQRLAAARMAGHVPRAKLVPLAALFGAVLLGLTGALAPVHRALVQLVRAPLEALALGHSPALSLLFGPLRSLAAFLDAGSIAR